MRIKGRNVFREISDAVGTETYWSWGLSVALNADGWDDVLVTCSMNFPRRFQTNSVLLERAWKAIPRQRVHSRRRAPQRTPQDALVRLGRLGSRPALPRPQRPRHHDGERGQSVIGRLRPGRRRRSRHRHPRAQRRAAGARQQSFSADGDPLRRDQGRIGMASAPPSRLWSVFHQISRREIGVPFAELAPPVVPSGKRHGDRPYRGPLAVGAANPGGRTHAELAHRDCRGRLTSPAFIASSCQGFSRPLCSSSSAKASSLSPSDSRPARR